VTDDPETTPPPKRQPRRRRSDHDPTFVPPPVVNERRRSRKSPTRDAALGTAAAAATTDAVDAVAAAEPESTGVDSAVTVAAATAAGATTWLPMFEGRSPDPAVCPFLRTHGADGALAAPIETPDAANRCAALAEAAPQSLRQQELVCLTASHVDCPRYLRGATAVTEVPVAPVTAGRTMTPAILGSIALLVLAFSASVVFVLARGDLELAAVSPSASSPTVASPSAVAGIASPSPSVAAVTSPTPAPSPSPSPAPTASPSPSPTASPTPTPSPTPTSRATRTPRPSPTSDRLALLEPCPDRARCYIYTVRRGDNLYSIARYFGVSQNAIYRRNPWLRERGLRAGQELRLPPPTR
jgi:hypothetical protein